MNETKIEETFSLVDRGRILELAHGLIKIKSITGDESDVMHYAKGMLEDSGLKTELCGSDGRPNLLSTLNPSADPFLIFNGHLDTKPIGDPDTWETDPFEPVMKDGRLYGRGASDCKSPCAVIMHVMEILKEMHLGCSVGAQLVCDEEGGGMHGTGLLVNEMERGSLRKPDYVIVGEKSNLKLRIAQRGKFNFSIRFNGTPSHTSRLVKVNAIAQAAKGVLAIQNKMEKYHPWVGHPIRNVTKINASSPSGIPPECIVDVYRGLIIDETPETVIAEIKEALDEAGKGDPEWSWELEAELDDDGNYVYRPPNYTPPDSELVKVMYRSVPLALGKEAELFDDYAGGNDGRFYRKVGVPSVAFGAIGGNHHAPNEYVDIDSLVALAKVYLTTALLIEK